MNMIMINFSPSLDILRLSKIQIFFKILIRLYLSFDLINLEILLILQIIYKINEHNFLVHYHFHNNLNPCISSDVNNVHNIKKI